MNFSRFPSKLPFETDSTGVLRVGKTRVALDALVGAFKNGYTCEEIVLQFPVLDVADVYLSIGFYLKNQTLIEDYLEVQNSDATSIRQNLTSKFPSSNLRRRLLARQSAQQPAGS